MKTTKVPAFCLFFMLDWFSLQTVLHGVLCMHWFVGSKMSSKSLFSCSFLKVKRALVISTILKS